jgi:hypothetical protein
VVPAYRAAVSGDPTPRRVTVIVAMESGHCLVQLRWGPGRRWRRGVADGGRCVAVRFIRRRHRIVGSRFWTVSHYRPSEARRRSFMLIIRAHLA